MRRVKLRASVANASFVRRVDELDFRTLLHDISSPLTKTAQGSSSSINTRPAAHTTSEYYFTIDDDVPVKTTLVRLEALFDDRRLPRIPHRLRIESIGQDQAAAGATSATGMDASALVRYDPSTAAVRLVRKLDARLLDHLVVRLVDVAAGSKSALNLTDTGRSRLVVELHMLVRGSAASSRASPRLVANERGGNLVVACVLDISDLLPSQNDLELMRLEATSHRDGHVEKERHIVWPDRQPRFKAGAAAQAAYDESQRMIAFNSRQLLLAVRIVDADVRVNYSVQFDGRALYLVCNAL